MLGDVAARPVRATDRRDLPRPGDRYAETVHNRDYWAEQGWTRCRPAAHPS
ncbi:hypothetical protein NKG94_02620 [Micromonospora sp. M12]